MAQVTEDGAVIRNSGTVSLPEKDYLELKAARKRFRAHWDCPAAHLNFLHGAKIITFDELDTIRERLQARALLDS